MTLAEATASVHKNGGVLRRGPRRYLLSDKDKNKPRLLCDDRGRAACLWHDDITADDWEVDHA